MSEANSKDFDICSKDQIFVHAFEQFRKLVRSDFERMRSFFETLGCFEMVLSDLEALSKRF